MARLRGPAPLTLHGKAELIDSVHLAVLRGDIGAKLADAALADLDSDLAQGRVGLADVPWRRALERAAELSRTYTSSLGTRTLDVLHVARALELGSRTFGAYDDRQAVLAKKVRLRVVRPQEHRRSGHDRAGRGAPSVRAPGGDVDSDRGATCSSRSRHVQITRSS